MALLLNSPSINAAVTGSGIFTGNDVVTIDFSQDLITGNTFTLTIDGGTPNAIVFATSNAATMDAIAAAVAADAVVDYCRVTGQNRIEFKALYESKELTITTATVTGGASQANLTISHRGIREIACLVTNPLLTYPTTIVDSNTAGTVYTGYALAGANVAEPVWAIKKVVTAANVATTTWADSNSNNDNIWNNRAALTYG